MKTKSQKGFGLVPVLLILILVSVVGSTGYYVYNQQNNNKTDKSEVAGDVIAEETPISTPTPTATMSPVTGTQPANTQKYLFIKEWGVKIAMPNSTYTMEYRMGSNGRTLDLVSSEQKAIGGTCGMFDFARLHLRLVKNSEPVTDEIEQAHLSNSEYVKIGDDKYYFVSDYSGGSCNPNDRQGQPISDQEKAANAKILEVSKTLSKV